MSRLASVWLPLCATFLALGVLACSSAGDVREWRPSDHKHTEEQSGAGSPQAPQVSGSAEPTLPGLDPVTIATWQRACLSCHGQLGRGDGPQAAMVKARD